MLEVWIKVKSPKSKSCWLAVYHSCHCFTVISKLWESKKKKKIQSRTQQLSLGCGENSVSWETTVHYEYMHFCAKHLRINSVSHSTRYQESLRARRREKSPCLCERRAHAPKSPQNTGYTNNGAGVAGGSSSKTPHSCTHICKFRLVLIIKTSFYLNPLSF